MKIIRTLLAAMVLAGGALSSGAVASADPGSDNAHAKKDRLHPDRGNAPVHALLRSITWE